MGHQEERQGLLLPQLLAFHLRKSRLPAFLILFPLSLMLGAVFLVDVAERSESLFSHLSRTLRRNCLFFIWQRMKHWHLGHPYPILLIEWRFHYRRDQLRRPRATTSPVSSGYYSGKSMPPAHRFGAVVYRCLSWWKRQGIKIKYSKVLLEVIDYIETENRELLPNDIIERMEILAESKRKLLTPWYKQNGRTARSLKEESGKEIA